MKPLSLLPLAVLLLAVPTPAYAYLDPGTGSMLLSVLIGLVSTGYFMARKLPSFARGVIFKATGKAKRFSRKHVVIYTEGANYWGTFRPLLEEFGRRDEPVEYLTSAEDDPCFHGRPAGLRHLPLYRQGKHGLHHAELCCLLTILSRSPSTENMSRRSPSVWEESVLCSPKSKNFICGKN